MMLSYGMAKCRRCMYNGVASCTTNSSGAHHSFDDEPAMIIRWSGDNHDERLTRYWYRHGKLHRLSGPAIINSVGHAWYLQGEFARPIKDQVINVANPIRIGEDVGTILRHVEGVFYEVLLGSKKVLVAKV